MATEIISNINSVLQQRGIRTPATFVQSTFNPVYFQFFYTSPGDLNVGDKVFVLFSVSQYIEAEIINITGSNVTIDTLIFILYPSVFLRNVVLPPDTGSIDLDVNVVAAFNPVVIIMQRQDYKDLATQSDWNGTYYQIKCGTNVMGETIIFPGYEVGAVVQVITESGLTENFTILDISTSGGFAYATFDKTWSVFSPFFLAIVNILSRLNFYVTLKITDNALNPQTRELRFTPGASGIMRAEISGALRSLLNLNFTDFQIVETEIRTEDLNLYSPFYFATKDNWIGSSESWVNYFALEDVKFCIAGAFQIGDPNNGYYNKYFGNTEGTKVYPELMPQFITQFENPVYFFGFPFSLSFLGNQNMNIGYEDYFVRYTITQANGNITEYDSDPFIFTDFVCLARLNVLPIFEAALLAGELEKAKKIEFRFGRIDSPLFLDAFAPITINVKRSIEQSCNTFFVKWLNTLGGWDYWLFEGKIYEGFKVENGNNYESYFDNISDTKDFENVTFKNVSPAVQVGSNTLTRNEAEGLKVLPTSPKIYWYNEDLSKWIGVRVEPGTFNIRSTKDDYFNIELTFVKPKYFNQYA
jgi:hypothetical protein